MRADLKRAWKALPAPVRRVANQAEQAFGRAVLPFAVARSWRRGRPAQGPVVVAGLHGAVLGLGQGARLFIQALQEGGVDATVIDMAPALTGPRTAHLASQGPTAPSRGVLVTHLNPPELELYLQRAGAEILNGRRHIGYWAWELPTAPLGWKRAFRYVDEVWCPSSFTAAALRAIAPSKLPIRVVPHPIFVLPQVAPDRARFGFPDEACVVLQAFDLRSTAARKNPFGALDAYLRAVPQASDKARLVCKLVGSKAFPDIFEQLKARVAERSDLILISEELSSHDMLTLTASADVILSLHRAEGFGLLLAEGMWLGKPVVATAWSGNMDFMDAESAALVDYKPMVAKDPQGMYSGALWADPDLEEAAQRLRELIADPAERAALGGRARARALVDFDRQTWATNVKALLLGSTHPARF
ncbi:MAG: glycosyltransferase family 4 protein [Caulobacteraceae bacterium]